MTKQYSDKDLENASINGYRLARKEFEKLLDDEIENEQDAIERKAVRDWSIIDELKLIKRKLKKK